MTREEYIQKLECDVDFYKSTCEYYLRCLLIENIAQPIGEFERRCSNNLIAQKSDYIVYLQNESLKQSAKDN